MGNGNGFREKLQGWLRGKNPGKVQYHGRQEKPNHFSQSRAQVKQDLVPLSQHLLGSPNQMELLLVQTRKAKCLLQTLCLLSHPHQP